MSKKAVIIVAIVLLAAGGAIGFAALNKGEMAGQAPDSTPSQTQPSTSDTTLPTSATVGAYIDYYDGVITQTQGTKILFFHAPWCPQCRALESSIESEGVPGGVTIIKVDYDTNRSLRQRYGVTIQTTLVKVDDEGNEIKKYVAYDDPSVESLKANLL